MFESSSVEAAPHDIEPSIQPSAELPSTPQNIQKPVSPPLPLREETLVNTEGEPPTLSIMFDQTTIESSSLESPIVTEAAQYDIELSEDVLNLESYIFGKSILLGSENTC
jgi:hypothetical protein